MTELDTALTKYLQSDEYQADYYDLVLNTDFYIPIDYEGDSATLGSKESVSPRIYESDGKSYLMLFDSEERLSAWAKNPINYVILAGFKVADLSIPDLHWAVNIGGGYAKEFVPDEIRWLKESVMGKSFPDQGQAH